MKEEVMDKPTFVYRDGMLADMEYVEWLSNVKARFRQSQIKASIRVNTAMLEFYWSIGRDLVTLRAEKRWGAGVVKQFALDMRQAFPNETGFSDTNVKYMKRWYSFYYERVTKGQQVADQMKGDKKRHQLGDQIETAKKSHQVGDQLEMPELFGKVPWRHHVQIFSHCATLDEALFYLNKIIEEGWSRSWLEDQIAAKLFLTQGSAVTNFSQTLPLPQSQLAKEILKDPYHFDFLTMKEKYDEHDLEEALVANVTQFLLELGKGFSYVGRQMELQMPGGQTFFPDLVFYHIPQHRYVIIELKAVKYIPEFAGKCKSTDKTIVEWSLQDIQKPLGVATYQLQEVVDRTVAELELKKKQRKEDEHGDE